jgi:beta-lactamase regulating signal transducer with metallopeptidase domain
VNSISILSNNLISWWIQVTVIAALGTALPMLFRIRHPRTQMAFYHFILAVCIALPLIEPWHHPLLFTTSAMQGDVILVPGVSWLTYVAWIFVGGMLVKLCWLAGGYLQIRRYRASATRIFPIPDSIRQARALTGTDARFGFSRNVDGPVTLGHVDPMILLPESFLTLDHDAQLSIACHELIHVRRNDWLVTLFEEIIATLFWCNPAVWVLQSHTKLSREQLVDSEVVALTAAPASYVQALLVMAGAPRKLKTVPAALFLNDGHLPHRVRSLLTQRSGSIGRLVLSYALVAGLLIVFTTASTLWFPLVGEAQTVETLKAGAKPRVFVKAPPSTFNVHVPGPPESLLDHVYYSTAEASSTDLGRHTTHMRVLPPPPQLFLQPLRALEAQGIRVVRPGEKFTPEEIARMQQALGDQTVVEVTQSEDGTVRQIKIQRRRSPDEISFGPLRFHVGPDSFFSTSPAVTADNADSVH